MKASPGLVSFRMAGPADSDAVGRLPAADQIVPLAESAPDWPVHLVVKAVNVGARGFSTPVGAKPAGTAAA